MNQRELTHELAKELGESKQQTREVVEALFRIMGRTLARGEAVCYSNFGTLKPIARRSSSSSAQPDAFQVKFKASSRLLEALQSGDHQVTFRKRRGQLPKA